jgi:hypothetical protein
MDRSDITDEIELFRYSRTCAAGGRAAEVLRTLRRLDAANEIGFVDLGRSTKHGRWRAGREGFDMQLNFNYINSLPKQDQFGALSLLVVHEGTHAAVDFTKLLDEMAARVLPIHYYRELSGPGVFNEANDPPRPGKPYGVIRIGTGRLEGFRKQSEALAKDRLIDNILSRERYTEDDYVTPQWVVDHLSLWGGIANRLPTTKGFYVSVLATSVERYFTSRIVDILESVATRPEWNEVIENVSRRRSLRIALDDLAAADRNLSRRVAALQQRWDMKLTDDPPRAPRRRPRIFARSARRD